MTTWLSGALAQVEKIEPERRLWLCVVLKALKDLEAPPGSDAHQDARAAVEDAENLEVLANLAGVDPAALRRLSRALLAGWRPPTAREWDRRAGAPR